MYCCVYVCVCEREREEETAVGLAVWCGVSILVSDRPRPIGVCITPLTICSFSLQTTQTKQTSRYDSQKLVLSLADWLSCCGETRAAGAPLMLLPPIRFLIAIHQHIIIVIWQRHRHTILHSKARFPEKRDALQSSNPPWVVAARQCT